MPEIIDPAAAEHLPFDLEILFRGAEGIQFPGQ
jgi:hypothetical protein